MPIAGGRTTPTSPTMNPATKIIDPSLPPWMRALLMKNNGDPSAAGGAFAYHNVPRTRKTSTSTMGYGNVNPKLQRQSSATKAGDSHSQTPVAPAGTRMASSAKLSTSRGGASFPLAAGSFPASHSVEHRSDAVSSFSSSTTPASASSAASKPAQRLLQPPLKVTVVGANVMGEESQGTPASNASIPAEPLTSRANSNLNSNDPDLAHCPGIVERLRSKFSNLNIGTLDNYGLIADTHGHHRDSGEWGSKPVRRVASLEDLLDRSDEDLFRAPLDSPKIKQVPKSGLDPGKSVMVGPSIPAVVEEPRKQPAERLFARNLSQTATPSANRYTQLQLHPLQNDAMKRARSMESLSSATVPDHVLPSGFRPKKASKDEFDYMVIIERSSRPPTAKKTAQPDDNGKSRVPDLSKLRLGIGGDMGYASGASGMGRWNSNADLDDELPRPDTVRNYKLMFESTAPLLMTLKQAARRYHDQYQEKQKHANVESTPAVVNGVNTNTNTNTTVMNNNNINTTPTTFTITAKDKPKPPPLPITQKPVLVKPAGLITRPTTVTAAQQKKEQPVTVAVPKVTPVEPATEDEVDITDVIRLSAKVPSANQPLSPNAIPIQSIQSTQRPHSPQPPLVNGVLKTTLKRVSDHDLSSADESEEMKSLESEMAKKPKVVFVQPKVEDTTAQVPKTTWQKRVNDFEGTVLPSTLHVSNGVAPDPSSSSSASETIAPTVGLKRRGGPLVPRSARGPPSAVSNTLTFNFVGTDVVPKIANTTPRFSVQRPVQKMTVNGVTEDEFDETIDLGGPPSGPCKYEFAGANVIIGRSSLLKKRNKQLRIAFDDRSISTTYEYPSELLMGQLLGQDESDIGNDPLNMEVPHNQPIIERPTLKNRPGGATSGGLANYTPSSFNNDDDVFQLGISRPAPAAPANQDRDDSTKEEPNSDSDDDVIIKPADADENVTWSNAGTSDLLF